MVARVYVRRGQRAHVCPPPQEKDTLIEQSVKYSNRTLTACNPNKNHPCIDKIVERLSEKNRSLFDKTPETWYNICLIHTISY